MIVKKNHSFHLVDLRPWPLMASLGALILTAGMVKWFHIYDISLIINGLVLTSLVSVQWWRDISRERTFQGLHTFRVLTGMKWGIILFIVSEVFFFVSFFWRFFHRRLSPTNEIGILWPPIGVYPFNPFQIPLLNTIILLSSGVTVTWAHHRIIEGNISQAKNRLIITVVLGVYFTFLQSLEYIEANFSISDAVYGSTFFMATGFHGLHVIIGTTFLIICLLRIIEAHFSRQHHFGFEAAAWYWHFVDVVWLFLYINIYWWGSYTLIINSKPNFQLDSPHRESIILFILLLSIGLSILLIALNAGIAIKKKIDREKGSPFECGYDPKSSARVPFSLHFFLVAVIFLIFDVEITLLMPMPVLINMLNIVSWSIISIMFIMILTIGTIHEWIEGSLEWRK